MKRERWRAGGAGGESGGRGGRGRNAAAAPQDGSGEAPGPPQGRKRPRRDDGTRARGAGKKQRRNAAVLLVEEDAEEALEEDAENAEAEEMEEEEDRQHAIKLQFLVRVRNY